MVQAPEAVGDITLNKPGRPFPGLGYLRQRGMAAAAGRKPCARPENCGS
jgi:hypothetical protein